LAALRKVCRAGALFGAGRRGLLGLEAPRIGEQLETPLREGGTSLTSAATGPCTTAVTFVPGSTPSSPRATSAAESPASTQ
jgi:hypothetical protein